MSTSPSGRSSGTQAGAGPGALVTVVEDLIADAALQMQARSGGTSLCGHTRGGTAVPPVKHSEGRWAALREVQRRAATDDPRAALAHTREAWTRDLALRRRTGGVDWIAYRSGGVEALDEVTERLAGSDGRPGSGMNEDQ